MSKNINQVIEITKKHNLMIKEEKMQFNESGVDFQVVFAPDENGVEWTLRLPRREDVMPRTKIEKKVLDFINQYDKSFQVPNWVIYTDDLIAYKKLDGVPMGTIDLNIGNYVWELDINNIPESFYNSMANVLVELHNLPSDEAVNFGIVVHTPEDARTSMQQRMNDVKHEFGVSENLWYRWQKWMNDDKMWPNKTGMIHGDLHAGHTMIDKNANVTGIIDWTEAKVSDISTDFLFNYKVFGEKGLEDLIHAYKKFGGYHWSKMKEHIIELEAASPVTIAEFALISGMDEYVTMAKQSLGVEDL